MNYESLPHVLMKCFLVLCKPAELLRLCICCPVASVTRLIVLFAMRALFFQVLCSIRTHSVFGLDEIREREVEEKDSNSLVWFKER